MLKKMVIIPAILTVAACGGGGGGGESGLGGTPPIDTPTQNKIIKSFTNGLSIASIETASDTSSERYLVLSQDGLERKIELTTEVFQLNTAANQIANYDIEITDYETDMAKIKVIVEDEVVVSIIATDKVSGAKAILKENPNGPAIALAGGKNVTNMPVSGDFIYSGTLLGGRIDGTSMKDGLFDISVNFGSGNGWIHGSVPFDSFWINGPINIDTPKGTFSGTLESHFGAPQGNTFATSTAEIFGNFHNEGATGVSGLLIEKSENPSFGGAIIGSQNPKPSVVGN